MYTACKERPPGALITTRSGAENCSTFSNMGCGKSSKIHVLLEKILFHKRTNRMLLNIGNFPYYTIPYSHFFPSPFYSRFLVLFCYVCVKIFLKYTLCILIFSPRPGIQQLVSFFSIIIYLTDRGKYFFIPFQSTLVTSVTTTE